MRTTHTVTAYLYEQPDSEVWTSLVNVFDEGVATGPVESMRSVTFAEAQAPRLTDLLARLDGVAGTRVHVTRNQIPDDGDFATADYVGFFGADLGLSFVTNGDVAFSASVPCSVCGLEDAFDADQVAALKIDEDLIGDADLINLPGGGLAVSERVLQTLAGTNGLLVRELIDTRSGAPSKRLSQISTSATVMTPCTEHTVVDGAPYCPGCGRGFGELDGYFFIRPDQTQGSEVISRHPSGRSMIYLSRSAYDALTRLDPMGREPRTVVQVCSH